MSNAQSVKTQLQNLINQANETTGNQNTDITSAVNSLVEGFGQGGSGEEKILTYTGISGITNMFNGYTFPETCEEVIIDVEGQLHSDLTQTFRGTKNVPKIILRAKNVDENVNYTCNSMFASCLAQEIDLTGLESENGVMLYSMNYMFSGASNLKVIKGRLNSSKIQSIWAYSSTFSVCRELEEIRFVVIGAGGIDFRYCTKLSADSMQSIADALVDLTGLTAQTIIFNKPLEDKMTDGQKVIITNKNWNLSFSNV